MTNPWRKVRGWLDRYWLRLAFVCLAGSALVAAGLLALPAVQQLATLGGVLNLGAKTLAFVAGSGALVASHSVESKQARLRARPTRKSWIASAAVLLLASGLAAWLWSTRERVLTDPVNAPVAVVIAQRCGNDTKPRQVVPTGDTLVRWDTGLPGVLELYRNNEMTDKTIVPILSGAGIHIAEPGGLEIKVWNDNGPVAACASLVAVGPTSARSTFKYMVAALIVVAFCIAWRELQLRNSV